MARFYIDLRSHFGTTEDPEGVELPDIATAKMEALKRAATLSESEGVKLAHECPEHRVDLQHNATARLSLAPEDMPEPALVPG
jgi:hypothetical protein